MTTIIAEVIADLCDGDEQATRKAAGCNHLSQYIEVYDMLDWYARDVLEQRREAEAELDELTELYERIS